MPKVHHTLEVNDEELFDHLAGWEPMISEVSKKAMEITRLGKDKIDEFLKNDGTRNGILFDFTVDVTDPRGEELADWIIKKHEHVVHIYEAEGGAGGYTKNAYMGGKLIRSLKFREGNPLLNGFLIIGDMAEMNQCHYCGEIFTVEWPEGSTARAKCPGCGIVFDEEHRKHDLLTKLGMDAVWDRINRGVYIYTGTFEEAQEKALEEIEEIHKILKYNDRTESDTNKRLTARGYLNQNIERIHDFIKTLKDAQEYRETAKLPQTHDREYIKKVLAISEVFKTPEEKAERERRDQKEWEDYQKNKKDVIK